MSREIGRAYEVMQLLGSMRAEERLATFLLSLAERMHVRGFSQSQLVLRMTRAEIGSFLGIKLETVSRTFSQFQREGMIEVHGKGIRILDAEKLKALVTSGPMLSPAPATGKDAQVIMNRFPPEAQRKHATT